MPSVAWLLRAARLLLPVLVPSWRFFDSIGPSPRIEFLVWTQAATEAPGMPAEVAPPWAPWTLTPETVGVGTMFARLLFNASRNEVLYLLACCERVVDEGSRHAEQQIAARLAAHIRRQRLAAHILEQPRAAHAEDGQLAAAASDPSDPAVAATCFRYRIVEVFLDGGQLQRHVAFESAPLALDDPGRPR